MTDNEDSPTYMAVVYSLTPLDYALIIAAGFKGQGLFWEVLWAMDNTGILWQADLDSDTYVQFYEHTDNMRPLSPRSMTRQEFARRFGV